MGFNFHRAAPPWDRLVPCGSARGSFIRSCANRRAVTSYVSAQLASAILVLFLGPTSFRPFSFNFSNILAHWHYIMLQYVCLYIFLQRLVQYSWFFIATTNCTSGMHWFLVWISCSASSASISVPWRCGADPQPRSRRGLTWHRKGAGRQVKNAFLDILAGSFCSHFLVFCYKDSEFIFSW